MSSGVAVASNRAAPTQNRGPPTDQRVKNGMSTFVVFVVSLAVFVELCLVQRNALPLFLRVAGESKFKSQCAFFKGNNVHENSCRAE